MIHIARNRSAAWVLGAVIALAAPGCVTHNPAYPLADGSQVQPQDIADPAAETPEPADVALIEATPDAAAVAMDAPAPEETAAVALDAPAPEADVAATESPALDFESHYVVARPLHVVDHESAASSASTAVAHKTGAAAPTNLVSTSAAETPDAAPLLLTNEVLAEVNGEVITREDILGPMRAELAAISKECPQEEFETRCRGIVDFRLRQIVTQRLLVQEAKAKLPLAEQDQLKAAAAVSGPVAADPAAAAPASLPILARRPDEPAIAPADWLLAQGFLRETIGPQVRVSQSELIDFYRQVAPERYTQPTKVRLGLITLKKSGSATLEWAESLATAVQSRAAAGEDFSKLAQRYGRGTSAAPDGDRGWITAGSLETKEVENVLFGLAAGQVGPLVETADTYYIVKALDRQDAHTVSFAEVQSALEQEIRERKYNTLVAGYLQDLYQQWRGQYKTAAASL
jgi:hypothetical protein